MLEKIGFTSTIPVEIIYAAGYQPVDLNNIFITSNDPAQLVRSAKMKGFPDTTCSWICGLYSTIIKKKINTIIGVCGGDCSETNALMEVLISNKKKIIPFNYPHYPDKKEIKKSINLLQSSLNASSSEIKKWKKKLDLIRNKVHFLDKLLWKENKAWGKEIHLYQLSCSDFEGNPEKFEKKIDNAIIKIKKRKSIPIKLRLGFIGVPPIINNLYDHLESNNVRIVFNEVQRQFSLPFSGDIYETYSKYTYPYGAYYRLIDINKAIDERKIDGIVHYVQSFCFRSIEDIVFRQNINVPILTLQGDIPSQTTPTMEIRIEAFLDMLNRKNNNEYF